MEEGKEKTKIVKHLGRVRSDIDIEKYRKIFALENQKDHVARADLRNLDIMPPREYGIIYASQVLCHDLGIDFVFEILGEYSEIIFLSVISRIIYPSSGIALLRISEKKDPMNDFMLTILGAAAEFERELISERVKDGMARAKSEKKRIGRPGALEKRGVDPSRIIELRESGKSIREISQLVGIKRSTVHGILKSVSEKPTSQN